MGGKVCKGFHVAGGGWVGILRTGGYSQGKLKRRDISKGPGSNNWKNKKEAGREKE